ncbi:MAG: leucine-rich repeat protein [Clostridiaceae bacterium]|nr:leucine-rich repeat protein [Clostridiaceae bacterium]
MKNTRKLLAIMLALVLVIGIMPLSAVNSFADSTVYTSADGRWKYQVLEDNTVCIYSGDPLACAYLGSETEVEVPSEIDGHTVTEIGVSAFDSCSRITKITIPSTIERLGIYAFNGCKSLVDINVPNSITDIPTGAFRNCKALSDIDLPYGIEKIGEGAFSGCTSLEYIEIPESVTEIGAGCFSGCTALTGVGFPSGITTFSAGLFDGCTSLESITVPDNVVTLENEVFSYCESLSQVVLHDGITQIGERAFYRCSGLKDIEIPNGVTTIKEETFADCNNLKSVILPDSLENIDVWAFFSCSSLNRILIPESVTQIAASAFDRSALYYVLGYSGTYAEEYPDVYTSQYMNELTFIPIDDYDCENGTHCNYVVYDDEGVTCECMICGEGFSDELPTLTDSEQVDFLVPAVDTGTSYDCYFNVAQTGFYTFEFEGAECSAVDICIGSESQEGYWYGYATTEHFEVPLMFEENVNYLLFFRTDGLPESDSFSVKVNFNGEHRVESFPDMPEDAWYYEAAMYNSDRGFITGYKNGNFGGADKLQRQDFIVVLSRISGFDEEVFSSPFMATKMTDVAQSSYYAAAVNWAAYNGIMTGYNNGKFGVGDAITREQVVTILYRYFCSPEVTGAEKTLATFADAGSISGFAKDAMVWAIQNNIISGKNATTLAPTATASRAEIATIIMRMDKAGMFD